MTEADAPRVHPDVIQAFREGAHNFPSGPHNPPDWWPFNIRQAYADGWWHSQWNAEGQNANV
jgi:hypothetical protein